MMGGLTSSLKIVKANTQYKANNSHSTIDENEDRFDCSMLDFDRISVCLCTCQTQ
jgi:hypothetical protein